VLEGAAPERIEVAPPGVDTVRFAPTDPPAEHLVLLAGRLVWEKGHQDLLRALALLRERGKDVRALVVGAGPEEERLEAHAADLGVTDLVEWRRSVPYPEMPLLYARASAVVLPSLPTVMWEEQFGMVLAEALAAGVPVLASQSGAIPEVLAGAGTLFPPGDWLRLAELLDQVTSQPPRRERHDELVRRYSAEAAAQRLRDAYARVLASR
jgi:glycosyltransferase involved in cell wall biosynthesis